MKISKDFIITLGKCENCSLATAEAKKEIQFKRTPEQDERRAPMYGRK
jgi:hypothetical protein